jgi:hypothetical protein
MIGKHEYSAAKDVPSLAEPLAPFDEDALNEYIVGKLAVDQVMWMDALVDGASLFDICDSDSQGLHEVHTILTKGKQEFSPT